LHQDIGYVKYFSGNALLGLKKECRMAFKKHKNKDPSGVSAITRSFQKQQNNCVTQK
jgi:hypothetical protein